MGEDELYSTYPHLRFGPSPSLHSIVTFGINDGASAVAVNALGNVVTNVYDWLKRLDELNTQIDQRQVELASFTDEMATLVRLMHNKRSTESFRPKDEGDHFMSPTNDTSSPELLVISRSSSRRRGLASAAAPRRPCSGRRSRPWPWRRSVTELRLLMLSMASTARKCSPRPAGGRGRG